jgi:RNA polymerase sigma factor (sigma-70 family)
MLIGGRSAATDNRIVSTREFLSTASYLSQRDYTLSVLGRRAPWLQPAEREEVVQEAFATMLEKVRKGLIDPAQMHPAQVRAYVVRTALNKALDEGKRAWRRRVTSLEHEDDSIDECAHPEQELDARVEQERVRKIVAGLSDRQQAIVKLRFYFDRTPEQISRHLGVTQRTYRYELERAKRTIRDRYRWSELEEAA